MSTSSELHSNESKLKKKVRKKNQQVIRRAEPYANALFSVALETLNDADSMNILNVQGLISNSTKLSSKLEFFDIYQNIDDMNGTFNDEREIVEFFENPLISVEKKKQYFSKFFPTVNKKIQNLVYLLIDSNKVNLIAEVLSQTLQKYWTYLRIQQYELTLGKFGTQLESNFISYQFSNFLKENLETELNQQSKVKVSPEFQIKNSYKVSNSIIGGFSLGFSQGTGFLNFTASNEFNKFFGRIDKKSSN